MNSHLRSGSSLLSLIWYQVAQRIVEKAVRIYELDADQTAALKRVFLRPNDFGVS